MTTTAQKIWTVQGHNGFESLVLNEKAPLPEVGDKDVLVKRKYRSPMDTKIDN
jgi:hypothetical protein